MASMMNSPLLSTGGYRRVIAMSIKVSDTPVRSKTRRDILPNRFIVPILFYTPS